MYNILFSRTTQSIKNHEFSVPKKVKSHTETNCRNPPHEPHVKENILHAVEVAEQAFVHALRDEVDNLFNDSDHREVRTVSMPSTNCIKESNTKGNEITVPVADKNDRNQFGWGLDQSIGF